MKTLKRIFTSDKDLVSFNYMLTYDLIKVHTKSLSKLETNFKNHYFIVIGKFSRTLNYDSYIQVHL